MLKCANSEPPLKSKTVTFFTNDISTTNSNNERLSKHDRLLLKIWSYDRNTMSRNIQPLH